MNDQAHFSHKPIEMILANLDRAEGGIPLPMLARSEGRLYIFHYGIGQREDLSKLLYDASFRFPPTPGRGGNALLPLQPIVDPFGASPLSRAACASHGSSYLHRIFHMVRGFCHEIEHGVFASNDTEPFKLTAWIDPHNQGLIVGFLLVDQLDTEHTKLVPLWSGFTTFEQVASCCRGTRHQGCAFRVKNRYSQGISLLPVRAGVI
jgi:hypothetical protein